MSASGKPAVLAEVPMGFFITKMINQWFKFYGPEYLSDPKILSLCATRRSCWITLLCFASVANDGGRIKYLPEESLMVQAGVDPNSDEWEVTRGCYAKFKELGMIDISDNGVVTVLNWNKRQESFLTNAERQARYRERHSSNAKVTRPLKKVTLEEKRIEKNRKDTGTAIAVRPLEDCIKSFQSVNPSYELLFGNKTERASMGRLLEKYGEDKVKAMVASLQKFSILPGCPQITTPYQLEKKLGQYIAFIRQQENKTKSKVAFL